MKLGILGLVCDACTLNDAVASNAVRVESMSRVEWDCPRCDAHVRQFVAKDMWQALVTDLQIAHGTAISKREVRSFSRLTSVMDNVAYAELFGDEEKPTESQDAPEG